MGPGLGGGGGGGLGADTGPKRVVLRNGRIKKDRVLTTEVAQNKGVLGNLFINYLYFYLST